MKTLPASIKTLLFAWLAALLHAVSSGAGPEFPTQPMMPASLASDALCERCEHRYLPGSAKPAPHTRYAIHSDLPEIFDSEGVLYATVPVLPPMQILKGETLSEKSRTQLDHGFKGIDGSFEIYLYHLNWSVDAANPRRLVVYARNTGQATVELAPRQIILSEGERVTETGIEATLGRRVLAEDWERPLEPLALAPTEGAILAWSKVVGAVADGPDASTEGFVTGTVRVDYASEDDVPSPLEVFVVAIPEANPAQSKELAEGLLDQGANSRESQMDITIRPPDCHLRRVAGVFENFMWVNDPLHLDAARFNEEGVAFQMALPAVQSVGCEEARQTQDLLLHPPYVRNETIGNYMAEYRVRLKLSNSSAEPRFVDLRFGKQDADIGLAYQVALGTEFPSDEELMSAPIRTGWAGAWRETDLPDNTRSFLPSPELIEIPAGEARCISLRFLILGSSSLPFQIHLFPAAPPAEPGGSPEPAPVPVSTEP